jgi:hypothetical protein
MSLCMSPFSGLGGVKALINWALPCIRKTQFLKFAKSILLDNTNYSA